MREMSVREARGHLSALLDEVEQGVEIIITRRGKKVAILSPVRTSGHSLPAMAAFRDSIRSTGRSLSETVIEDREETRY